MAKILVWVAVIVAVLFGMRLVSIAKARRRDTSASGLSGRKPATEPMVKCVRCGIYLPGADAKPGPDGMTCGEPACVSRK